MQSSGSYLSSAPLADWELSPQVVDIWHRCKEKGWVLPTVYQGMYNGITRDCEKVRRHAPVHAPVHAPAHTPLCEPGAPARSTSSRRCVGSGSASTATTRWRGACSPESTPG